MRALAPLLFLAACAQVPALDGRIPAADRAAPPPALVPLGPILALAGAGAPAPVTLEARLDRLSARAAILRGPVLSAADRARLGL
jgi:hypothetical protein